MKNLLFLLLFLLLSECKKNELDALPPLTQEGKNTFGCLINGKAYVPEGGGGFSQIKAVDGGYQGIRWKDIKHCIWVRTYNKDGSGMDLWIRNVEQKGDYELNFDTGVSPTVILPYNYGYYFTSSIDYITTSQYSGKVHVTKADTITGIIAGTFEFICYSPAIKEKISVTNGRFDIQLHP